MRKEEGERGLGKGERRGGNMMSSADTVGRHGCLGDNKGSSLMVRAAQMTRLEVDGDIT